MLARGWITNVCFHLSQNECKIKWPHVAHHDVKQDHGITKTPHSLSWQELNSNLFTVVHVGVNKASANRRTECGRHQEGNLRDLVGTVWADYCSGRFLLLSVLHNSVLWLNSGVTDQADGIMGDKVMTVASGHMSSQRHSELCLAGLVLLSRHWLNLQ